MSPDSASRRPSDSVSTAALAQTVLEVLDTVVLVLDEEGRIQYLNPACEELTGYEAEELRGTVVFNRLIPKDEREDVRRYWDNLWDGTAEAHHRNPWITKDGERCYLKWSNALMETETGRRYVVATGTDISRRRELERDVVQVSENERQRIGQELHDTLASDLVAAAMKMDNLRCRLQKQHSKSAELHSRLEDIETSIRQTSKQARSLSHLLAAGQIEGPELPGALSELVDTYREASDVECQLQLPDETLSDLVSDSAAGHLYRIAQEAVRNAIHHGHPSRVEIQVDVVNASVLSDGNAAPENRKIVLLVRDDGTGIPEDASTNLHVENSPNAAPRDKDLSDGIGLHLMTYRADLVDGTLTIDSTDEEGTVVRCTIPVK